MNPAKKRWIILTAVSLLTAGGLGFLIYFQRQRIEENRALAENLRQTIAQHRELIKTTPDLIKRVIVQRETDAVIKEILPNDEGTNDLVRALHQFGQESGFVITSLKKQRDATSKKGKQDFEKVGYTLAFDADAFQLLTFLDKVESHPRFMNATAFKLTAANRNDYAEDGGPRHSVQIDLETYVYRPTGVAKEVKVDQYERKRDLLISEISKRAAELRVPRYDYRGAQGRRDPFIDPRVPVDGDGGPVLSIEEQIAIVDELIEHATQAQELMKGVVAADNLIAEMKARAALEEKIAFLDEEVRRIREEGQLVFIPAQRRFEKQVVDVVASLRDKLANAEQGQGPSLAALRQTAETMEHHIQAQEYEMALEVFDAIEPRLALAEREELKRALVQSLRDLRLLAETVIEFEKIDLQINGIAIYENHRPVALINGQPVSEGELIGEELVVRNIGPDQIEFAFRGLVLARTLESGSTNSPQ